MPHLLHLHGAPAGFMAVTDPNHVLPRTYEVERRVERTFGMADVLTVTYLGAGAGS